jgi:hypothetical protein
VIQDGRERLSAWFHLRYSAPFAAHPHDGDTLAELDRRRISLVTVRVAMPDAADGDSGSSSKSRKRGAD